MLSDGGHDASARWRTKTLEHAIDWASVHLFLGFNFMGKGENGGGSSKYGNALDVKRISQLNNNVDKITEILCLKLVRLVRFFFFLNIAEMK